MANGGKEPGFGDREDDVQIDTPIGWKLKLSGRHTVVLIAIITCTAFIMWMLRDHDLRAAERSAVLTNQSNSLHETQKDLTIAVDNLVWVMLLPESERAKLKLDMPDSMRRKLSGQRGM